MPKKWKKSSIFRLKLYPFKAKTKSIPILGYMLNLVPLLAKKCWPNFNSLKLGQVTATKNKFSKKGYKILLFYPYKGTNKSHQGYLKFLGLQKRI